MALFYFKQFQIGPPTKEDIAEKRKNNIISVVDCIDPEYILRGRMYPDGSSIILLKDGHETTKAVEVQSKNGVKTTANQKIWVQTEINLNPEDTARLRNIMEILLEGESPYLGPVAEGKPNLIADDLKLKAEGIDDEAKSEVDIPQIGPNDKY